MMARMNVFPISLAARLALAACLAGLCGCSSPPAVEKKPEPPPEPLTGQTALYRMYQVARAAWARDVMVERMSSMKVNGVADPAPGLANAWEAVFFSASKASSRSYTDSIVEQLPDLHKDVFGGPQQSPSGTPFLIAAVKTDSVAAYKTAVGKLSKAEEQGIQGKPVLILLEMDRRYPDPVWRIVWGESLSTATVSVFVDANTGQFEAIMH
jgi:hypothetical protein